MGEVREMESTEESQRRSPWVKRLVITFLLFMPVLLVIQLLMYRQMAGGGELQEAIAEADRLDPRWRLEELEEKRAVLPEEQNSALLVLRITGWEQRGTGILPDNWPKKEVDEALERLSPEELLSDEQLALVREELGRAGEALPLARRLVNMPYGRYPITYTSDGISTLLPHLQPNRRCGRLLEYDAMVLAQEKKLDEAIASCYASINTARAIGDEPTMISMLVRVAVRAIAIRSIERVLAQGEASEQSLAGLQKLLEMEAQEPILLVATRSERALNDRVMQAVQKGEISPARLLQNMGERGGLTNVEFLDNMILSLFFGSIKQNRAALLRLNNRFVEIAKLPLEEQHDRYKDLEREIIATINERPRLVRLLLPAIGRVAEAHRRGVVDINCAITAVAAERYRLKNGRWPESLNQLAPNFLSKVPLDPFAKAPLRLAKKDSGLFIYSIGSDGIDNGGKFNRPKRWQTGNDEGFELWDVGKRRQAARAKPKSADEEGDPLP